MSSCDFEVALRIVAADGTTVRGDLNDQANGIILMSPIVLPLDNSRRERYTSPRSKGDFTQGPPLEEPGELVAIVDVEGTTWPQVETRWDAVRDYLRLEWDFFIEYEAEGVTKRWRTERPNIEPQPQAASDFNINRLTYQLRFICQPNPTVTL